MNPTDGLRSWLFRSLMFEAEAEQFRGAGIRVGLDERSVEDYLLEEELAPFPLEMRNEAIRMARLYALVFCLENSIRELIKSRLAELEPTWWTTRVPTKLRATAQSRFEEAKQNSWLEGVSQDLLSFVDFGGLCDIITNSWADFEDLIPSQHWLRQRLDELERARNFIAHNRMLAPPEFRRLEMYIGDWNRQVGV